MMKSEDKQLSQDTSDLDVPNTVLLAANRNSSQNNEVSGSSSSVNHVSQSHVGTSQPQGVGFPQFSGTSQPQGDFLNLLLLILHHNHFSIFPNSSELLTEAEGVEDQGHLVIYVGEIITLLITVITDLLIGFLIPVYPNFPPQAPRFSSQFSGQSRPTGGFRSSGPSMLPMQGSQSVPQQKTPPFSSAFAGFTDSYVMPHTSSGYSSGTYAMPQSFLG
ncbi:hypothetical protein RHGRI_029784 [Rhododendron griersonianum]|uniref:Uncharacterized protein n=1 Tax=Rhododendron griersonianum TaxID=479676 RepID=A0AAV6IKQ7_9ERIC|nr:hypothetical protein RHGRI_029784 [Rhododendron griersonianum]